MSLLRSDTPQVVLRCETWRCPSRVSCLQATGEAEALCAALATAGLVSAVLTSDSDVLAFGVTSFVASGEVTRKEGVLVFKALHVDAAVAK